MQRPSERGLIRSKSVGAIGKSARPYREWATVPAVKEATTRTRVSEAADRPYREVQNPGSTDMRTVWLNRKQTRQLSVTAACEGRSPGGS